MISIALLRGQVGIGHVRYPHRAARASENSQPLLVKYKDGAIAVAHNGNLVNSCQLREQLEQAGDIFYSTSDTEVIAHLFVKELLRYDLQEAVRALMRKIVAPTRSSFCGAIRSWPWRDPLGIKPLCIGEIDSGFMVASESAAVDTLNGKLIRDVMPRRAGDHPARRDEVVSTGPDFPTVRTASLSTFTSHGRTASWTAGLIYDVRVNIGANLAREHPADADTVTPFPTRDYSGGGLSSVFRYQLPECLMKNRYIGRTFIMPDQNMRETAVSPEDEHHPAPTSRGTSWSWWTTPFVRGTTSRRIVDMVRRAGAEKVHVRIGSRAHHGALLSGHRYGSREELIAPTRPWPAWRRGDQCDSLGYVSTGPGGCVGIPKENLCMGCL